MQSAKLMSLHRILKSSGNNGSLSYTLVYICSIRCHHVMIIVIMTEQISSNLLLQYSEMDTRSCMGYIYILYTCMHIYSYAYTGMVI